jgi:hypothetical protein
LENSVTHLLDHHNGLLGHKTEHTRKDNVVDIGEDLALATMSGYGDGGKLFCRRGGDLI